MIGVLALQGGFIEHIDMLKRLGADSFEIRKEKDIYNKKIDGIIFPGGESTVIGKLLKETGLFDGLKKLIDEGTPVLGTCAGLILLAKQIENDNNIWFSAMDICAKRNAYGRQLGSFNTAADFDGIGKIPMTFIRAPYITKAGATVKILAQYKDKIIAAEQNNILVTAFHPELTNDLRIHEYFLKKCYK